MKKNDNPIEVSVVMPCLNEESTIGKCIEKIKKAFEEHNIRGEIVVSDNGSKDKSVEISSKLGARVVQQPIRGYGNAYIKGITSAKGKYIIIGDADDTYDFSELNRFITPLKSGADIVMGSRLKGKILKGAMPFLHRYIGNPVLSAILNIMFKVKVSDVHCGIRSFKKDIYNKLDLKTPGMEYASEFVIKAAKANLKIIDIPITYYPREGESKLRTFADGWRHLRFMLLLSPEHLFLMPGGLMTMFGISSLIILLQGPIIIFNHNFDLHMMILSSFFAISGLQILFLGMFTQVYSNGIFTCKNRFISLFTKFFSLEKGMFFGTLLFLIGFFFSFKVFYNYLHSITGDSIYYNARLAVFGVTLMISGLQVLFSSFYIGFLDIKKAYENPDNLS